MKRLLALLAALAFLCAAPAHATVHRLMAYIAPIGPLPSTQTINFGEKTEVGEGGSPMGYKTPALLGASTCLAITSQVDKSSGAVSIFQLDDRYMLVPKNGAVVYGAPWISTTTLAAGTPYTVVVEERVFSGGNCTGTPTSAAPTTILVPIITKAVHVREMGKLVANGCQINCEVTHPDGGTGSFAAEKNQINDAIKKTTSSTVGGTICLGDTVYLRNAGNGTVSPTKFNPLQNQYDVRPASLAELASNTLTRNCAGATGRVTYISETIDSSTDSYGLPALQHGFRFGGGIRFNVNDFGAGAALPIDFDDVYCYEDFNQTVSTGNACFTYNLTTVGTGGVGLYSSRCEVTVAVIAEQFCMNSYGAAVTNYNRFIYTGITVRAQLGTLTAIGNVGQNLREDMFSIGCSPDSVITDNLMFNPTPKLGVHQDFEQSVGCQNPWNFGTVARNILVLNDIAALANVSDNPQFVFNANPTCGTTPPLCATASNAIIDHNIGYSLATNMIDYSYWNNGTINFNTVMSMANPVGYNSSVVAPRAGQIGLQSGQGVCCDITANNNVANGGNFNGQPGTIIDANRVTVAWTGVGATDITTYHKAFPSLVTGPGPMGATNRAAAILQFAPAYQLTVANGGVWNGDGSYSGALTPPDSGGHPCWNTGLTNFVNTQTCAQQSLTPAT